MRVQGFFDAATEKKKTAVATATEETGATAAEGTDAVLAAKAAKFALRHQLDEFAASGSWLASALRHQLDEFAASGSWQRDATDKERLLAAGYKVYSYGYGARRMEYHC